MVKQLMTRYQKDVKKPHVPPQLSDVDLNEHLRDRDSYNRLIRKWQQRMKQVQLAYYHQRRRAIIVFEGWDAGGKGGAIRRVTEKLDPRGFVVHPISAPTPEEQGRHYLYRFVMRLPIPGTLAIFDRSYYGRVLVERVEGFAQPQEWQRAYREINEWERSLLDDDVRIVKVFMHISQQEQLERFAERLNNPLKQWKLTEEDIRNRSKWQDYELAINEMFQQNSTELAPWTIVPADNKWFARVKVLRTVVEALEHNVDTQLPLPNAALVKAARLKLGIDLESIE